MKLSPQLRLRLQQARRAIQARSGIVVARWSDDQLLSMMSLTMSGLSERDAAAVVMGDAVLEDGKVDYEPGCAWIDFALAHRHRSVTECERIVAEWEAQDADAAGLLVGSNVVPMIASPQMAASIH